MLETGDKWIDFSEAFPSVIREHHVPRSYHKLRIICMRQHVFLGSTKWIPQNMENV